MKFFNMSLIITFSLVQKCTQELMKEQLIIIYSTVCMWYIQKYNVMAKVFVIMCDILNAVLHFTRDVMHFASCEQFLDLCVKFWKKKI